MSPISVPLVPAIYKIIAGIPFLILAVLALYWGWKNLHLTLHMLQGKVPLPRGSSPLFVVMGIALYLLVLVVGVGATCFFLALETSLPVIISQDGIDFWCRANSLLTKKVCALA